MKQGPHVTVAICTYNRSSYLPALVEALRSQSCPIEFDILFINNNSKDDTLEVLEKFSEQPGIPIRIVSEPRQGIVHARNRAIEECLTSDFMLVMDDDELPSSAWVAAAYTALKDGEADCVGGRVDVCFDRHPRPTWLGDELLGFLAETDYGSEPFTVTDDSTPLWTANIAYNMRIFRDDPDLRFDARYNREGDGVGGGEDVLMFNSLLERGHMIKYEPAMVVKHHVEPWRLKRRYFLKLHFTSGLKKALHELPAYDNTLFGVPPFLIMQFFYKALRLTHMAIRLQPQKLRQAMNVTHAAGMICGVYKRKFHQP
jgi:glycosyltransferase involved in cell wall biosynthesis